MQQQQSTCISSIDCTDNNGKAALHHGAAQKHIVKHLLAIRTNPLLEDIHGNTPQRIAQQGDADNAAKLLQEEQKPNALS